MGPIFTCASTQGKLTGSSLIFTNPVGTGGVWYMCLCLGCGAVGGVRGVGGWPGQGLGWMDGIMSLESLCIWQV